MLCLNELELGANRVSQLRVKDQPCSNAAGGVLTKFLSREIRAFV